MNSVKILDVTLRDGGYRNNFNFTEEFACYAVSQLAEAGIPFCEIGYCNGSFIRKPEHGLTSVVNSKYLKAIKSAAGPNLNLAIMIHPRNVNQRDLEMLRENGISMIRICLRRDQLEDGVNMTALAKSLGFFVSANVTHVTTQTLSAVIDTALHAEAAGADLICFADSNGNMIPADVDRLISKVSNRVLVPLGFHAHNNLSLALANAITAIQAGAEYIDTSICGMGKGAGNLHLSMLIAYLERIGSRHHYDLVKVMELSQSASSKVAESNVPAPLLDIMLGAYNFSYDSGARIQETLSNYQLPSEFHALQVMHEEDQASRPSPRVVNTVSNIYATRRRS